MVDQGIDVSVTLQDDAGRTTEYDAAVVKAMLKSGMRPTSVTISVKEGRQRAQYQGTERFISATLDLAPDLVILDSVVSDRLAANKLFGEALTEKIMETENYLYSRVLHMQAKDGVSTYARNKTNPYVEHPSDLNAALKAANGILP